MSHKTKYSKSIHCKNDTKMLFEKVTTQERNNNKKLKFSKVLSYLGWDCFLYEWNCATLENGFYHFGLEERYKEFMLGTFFWMLLYKFKNELLKMAYLKFLCLVKAESSCKGKYCPTMSFYDQNEKQNFKWMNFSWETF